MTYITKEKMICREPKVNNFESLILKSFEQHFVLAFFAALSFECVMYFNILKYIHWLASASLKMNYSKMLFK